MRLGEMFLPFLKTSLNWLTYVLVKSQYPNLPAIVCSFDATVCIDLVSGSTLACVSMMCSSLFWSLGTFGAIAQCTFLWTSVRFLIEYLTWGFHLYITTFLVKTSKNKLMKTPWCKEFFFRIVHKFLKTYIVHWLRIKLWWLARGMSSGW